MRVRPEPNSESIPKSVKSRKQIADIAARFDFGHADVDFVIV
jgi:hypothetical protein